MKIISRGKTLDSLIAAAEQFTRGKVADIREFGGGNINRTFLVTRDSGRVKRFILQRVNTRVFPRPELVMLNMRVTTGHIRRRLGVVSPGAGRRWEVPRVIRANDGNDHWRDPEGSFWRAISFIECSQSFLAIKDDDQAGEVGYALGFFHSLLSDLPPERLADTIQGFHVTPLYLMHYDEVVSKCPTPDSPEVNYCMRFVSARTASTHVLENARLRGRLFLRPIHGDPKVSNILMDTATGKAVSIVDLDTVKPGLVHYDIGDCLRSCCNTQGEEIEEWENVHFDTDLCRAVLRGYLLVAGGFLTANDLDYLYDSVRLIAFELGLRYFTDYLEGNVYFRVKGPEHNLWRALVQFRLTESIESQEAGIKTIIRDLICTASR